MLFYLYSHSDSGSLSLDKECLHGIQRKIHSYLYRPLAELTLFGGRIKVSLGDPSDLIPPNHKTFN